MIRITIELLNDGPTTMAVHFNQSQGWLVSTQKRNALIETCIELVVFVSLLDTLIRDVVRLTLQGL